MDGLKRLEPHKPSASTPVLPDLQHLGWEALEQLPVAVALGLLGDGESEPEFVHGNRALARLLGRPLAQMLPCTLTQMMVDPRSALQCRRAAARFAEGEGFSEALVLAGCDDKVVRANCEWTPLGAAEPEGRYWSAMLTVRPAKAARAQAMRGSSDKLSAIFEYSPVDISLKDVEGRYVLVSKRFEEIYGITNEEIHGKRPEDIGLDPDWTARVNAADRQVLETRKAVAYEETIPLRGGSTIEAFTVKFPLIAPSGELQGIGCICTDITERRVAERALLASEREVARSKALLSEAIESMTDGFVWFDSDGRLVLCNQKYRDLYPKLGSELKVGAAYSDLMKLAFDRDQFTVMAGADDGTVDTEVSKVFRKHPTFRTKTSEGRWIEARNHPLETGGFIGIRFDVTEQVAAEEALKESEQRFKDFAQSGPGGFWETDETLRLSSFLDVQTDSGRSRPTAAAATGRTLWELFAADTEGDPYWRRLRQDLEARRPVKDLRAAFVSDDGERFYWRINGKPY